MAVPVPRWPQPVMVLSGRSVRSESPLRGQQPYGRRVLHVRTVGPDGQSHQPVRSAASRCASPMNRPDILAPRSSRTASRCASPHLDLRKTTCDSAPAPKPESENLIIKKIEELERSMVACNNQVALLASAVLERKDAAASRGKENSIPPRPPLSVRSKGEEPRPDCRNGDHANWPVDPIGGSAKRPQTLTLPSSIFSADYSCSESIDESQVSQGPRSPQRGPRSPQRGQRSPQRGQRSPQRGQRSPQQSQDAFDLLGKNT